MKLVGLGLCLVLLACYMTHLPDLTEPPRQSQSALWLAGEASAWQSFKTSRQSSLDLCFMDVCVAPALQVTQPWTIDIVPCQGVKGWRFRSLMFDGFHQHPAVTEGAGVTFWIPTCAPKLQSNATTLVVLEESDKPGFWPQVKRFQDVLYFKRSWVEKSNGSHVGGRAAANNDRDRITFLPFVYSLWDNYTTGFVIGARRPLAVACTVRTHARVQPARTRVVSWLNEELGNRTDVFVGDTGGHRKKVDKTYFDVMRSARIVVTCHPSDWDGDFRLFEALASGALVFTDELHTPMPFPLRDGVHVVVYDSRDKQDFLAKLRYYMEHSDVAAKIAVNGLAFALTYHRPVSRVDYILRSLHEHLFAPSSDYTETGFQILRAAGDHELHRSAATPL